jgi:hypothetical protein
MGDRDEEYGEGETFGETVNYGGGGSARERIN